jgi:hypothetical protein
MGDAIDRVSTKFHDLHERKHGRGVVPPVGQVEALIDRAGGEEQAAKAVEAMFSPDLQWVKDGEMTFLLNPRLFEKHVIPAMSRVGKKAAAKRGEQSEYGDRPDGSGHRKVW